MIAHILEYESVIKNESFVKAIRDYNLELNLIKNRSMNGQKRALEEIRDYAEKEMLDYNQQQIAKECFRQWGVSHTDLKR